jgi:drug/metabolite transporter (DMT)-like permease
MFPRKARVTPPAEHRPTGASLIAILLVFLCFGAVMLLHAVRGEINPLRRVMSEYANGSHGILMTVVFYAFGLTSLALAFRLRHAIHRPGITRAFPALLALAGIGLIASGVFEVERAVVPDTIEEVIHSDATVAAFVLLITAMLLFSLACRGDDRWWSFRWVSMTLTLFAAFAAMITPLSTDTGWSGAVQRILGLTILSWLLLTALHVRGKAFRAK